MENFVLNLFSDQLSKIILDFHQSTINANFLSGKGSITNIKLNVGLINDFLNKPPHGAVPFLEFTEITLTELRVEVTSYTNLKKAPIVLVIEEIHAKAREPLEYHVNPPNATKKKNNPPSNKEEPSKKNPSQPQQYGLLHRILDNLSIKIKRIHLSFSSLGKFKTRRRGIWTPPTLQVCFDNVEWISVTETGNPGTPDRVWAHNELREQQSRFKRDSLNNQHRHRSYTIYKRLSMICHVKLLLSGEQNHKSRDLKFNARVPQAPSEPCSGQLVSNLISDTKVDVHLAYIRRLRDACVTGADMDVKVYDVDINLDVASYCKKESSLASGCDLGAFVHMLVGLIHCYYKDRSFVDPLLPNGVVASNNEKPVLLRGFSPSGEKEIPNNNNAGDEQAGPDDFLPEVAFMDDDLESSDESDYEEELDEEHDEAFLAWKRDQEEKERSADANERVDAEQGESNDLPLHSRQDNILKALSETPGQSGNGINTDMRKEGGKPGYKRKRKAVIVVASGAQKFEKLSFSFSIPRINMKLCLPPSEKESKAEPSLGGKDNTDSESNHHCLELLLEGLVAECIWPKDKSGEMGGHVQGSIKYCHILESAYQKDWGKKSGTFGPKPWNVVKIFPLLRIGTRLFQGHNAFSLSPQLDNHRGASSISKCDEFPMMELRQTTRRWDRQLKGPRALAFKSTISFVDETLTRWTKTYVQHEASLGELEVVLDSAPFERLSTLFSDPRKDSAWFDNRWLSGEWHAEITTDLIEDSKGDFRIKDHLQPLPSLYPTSSKQSAPSSELRRITAHLGSITVRLPNPMQEFSSFRMADVIFNISEATVLVSSDLPSSFLSGVVAAENTTHDFPNDSSDITSVATEQTAGSARNLTKFRMQMSFDGCSLKVLLPLNQDERFSGNLVAPTNVTIMMSLEHDDVKQSPNDTDHRIAHPSRSLILSILVQRMACNVELRSIYFALETLRHHAQIVHATLPKKDCSSADTDKSTSAKSNSAFQNVGEKHFILCIHVPDVVVNILGEQRKQINLLKASKAKTSDQHALLCQVKAGRFEFGMESTKFLSHHTDGQSKGAVYKCAITNVMVEICSANFEMVEILSMGSEISDSSWLIEKASAICFPEARTVLKRGFFLRSESAEKILSTSANAVEIASPLAVDLNIDAIESFLNHTVECLISPVFVGLGVALRRRLPIGHAIFTSISKLSALFRRPRSEPMEKDVSNSLIRLYLHQLLLIIPSLEGQHSFGLSFSDVEIALGELQCNMINLLDAGSKETNSYRHIIEKNCGSGDRSWLKLFQGLTTTSAFDTFYALRSNHSMIRIESNSTPQLKVIVPTSSINWVLPVGLGSSSSAPPFDVFAMKELSLLLMNMGMPLSSLYFKLYKLSPQNESASEFSLAAKHLHNAIGGYHHKMHTLISRTNAEVNRLREAVFFKEQERVGALALASSNASGWVRVGEDLSYSHRIFSSATFWRYWMVLNQSLLILYKSPGTRPSFVIPLRASSQLRSLENKTSSGIVGNHVEQNGFAVFDSAEGTGLFFILNTRSEYNMWVQEISMALKKVSSTDLEADSSITQSADVTTDHAIPPAPSAALDPSLEVFNGAPTKFAPGEACNLHSLGKEFERTEKSAPQAEPHAATSDDQFETFDVPAPVTAVQEEPSKTPSLPPDDSEMEDISMDEISLEEISLGESQKRPNEFSAFNEIPSIMEDPSGPPTSFSPPTQAPQEPISQSLPMRERLALAKGKSKAATSKFGSALKTAKVGMLATSETCRDGATTKEADGKEEPPKRMLAVGKMSRLKRNASTKLTAARSSLQDHISAQTEDTSGLNDSPVPPSSLPRDDLSGNRKLIVGQKIGNLKKSASTKMTSLGTSVRSSMQDQALKSVNSEDASGSTGVYSNLSPDEVSANKSSKQELRKKLANLDQSMSNTMRRLKIDEKVTQLSSAVKSGVKNDPVMRQISNVRRSHLRNIEHPKQRLGIGEESKSIKPIKFDARETFAASSDLPFKVKSITPGESLLIDDDSLSEKVESLEKINGSWLISVIAIECADTVASTGCNTNGDVMARETMPLINQETNPMHSIWKYKIVTTGIMSDGSDICKETSVEKTMSELLSFHTLISEIVANYLPSAAETASHDALIPAGTIHPIFEKLSTLDRLQVSGTLLQRALEVNIPSANSGYFMRDNQCEMVKLFVSTLLECRLPEEAASATKVFLNIVDSLSKYVDDRTHVTSARSVDEAFDLVSETIALEKKAASSQTNSVEFDSKYDRAISSLLNVIMDGYTKAMIERDEALASLATMSIINDNRIMQEHLRRSDGVCKSQAKVDNSDEDTVNLCKHLGSEIALRTTAEAEINRLGECLEFERKVAQAKEDELRAKIARYERESQNMI